MYKSAPTTNSFLAHRFSFVFSHLTTSAVPTANAKWRTAASFSRTQLFRIVFYSFITEYHSFYIRKQRFREVLHHLATTPAASSHVGYSQERKQKQPRRQADEFLELDTNSQ